MNFKPLNQFWLKFVRFFYRKTQWLLLKWIRVTTDSTEIKDHLPYKANAVKIYYALENNSLSYLLVLSWACRKIGLPDPLALPLENDCLNTPVFFIQRREGVLFSTPELRTHPHRLAKIIDNLDSRDLAKIVVIPVSILFGRSPSKSGGAVRQLFAETWAATGRIRQLISIIIHGRNTLVQFCKPIEIASVIQEASNKEMAVRKIARITRVTLRDVRTTVIGPDLSHRRTLVETIIRANSVQLLIKEKSENDVKKLAKLNKEAKKYAHEIAADYSYSLVRIAEKLLSWLWNKLYDGIHVNHFEQIKKVVAGNEIIYLPCHRSHIDYLLLSYVLYHKGLVPPHIAAGINLNIPIIGSILRRGGAFFIRRSFKNNQLYSAVFYEYVNAIFSKGVSLEYFIEGTRSRTGRLLPPQTGMLAMTLRSYLKESKRPVVLVPVYIGYEKLAEGRAYYKELSGQPKRSESFLSFLQSWKIIKSYFGHVHLNFGEPIYLSNYLDNHEKNWRRHDLSITSKPVWLPPLVNSLANQVMLNINAAADVNPINLIALALLSTPRRAMGEIALINQIALYKKLLKDLPYARKVTVCNESAEDIINYGLKLGIIQKQSHELGHIIAIQPKYEILISYYRNNILHLFALPAWIASCLNNQAQISISWITRLGRIIYPFLKAELFLHWSTPAFSRQIKKAIQCLESYGLINVINQRKNIARPEGSSIQALQLSILSQSIVQTFERFYITIILLVKHGSGKLSQKQLENYCQLYAERLSILLQFNAPEFFDKTLFKQFIQGLCNAQILTKNKEGNLEFDKTLNVLIDEAKILLSKPIRHGILQITEIADASETI